MPKGSHALKLTGRVFGRLAAIERAPKKPYSGNAAWRCRCECGNERIVLALKLTAGATKSCGCLKAQMAAERRRTHGRSNTREFHAWAAAKQRCTNPNHIAWNDYGGRGIRMCQRWLESFQAFLDDMGAPPSQSHTIDRVNSNGGYEPGNCRWATPAEQARNKRTNRRIEFQGRTMTVAEWERALGFTAGRIKARLLAGWSVERALTAPRR